MEINEALEIVRKLADGVHPDTGELISADSLFQHARVVRALNRGVQALEFQQERERARRFLPSNAGKPWSKIEDAQMCEEMRRGINYQEIARLHDRTVGSIVARLMRLGKISANTNHSHGSLSKSM
jgi:hypothetical protein